MAPIYIGIDWSETKHDVCILNIHGAILQEFVIEQTPAGCTLLAVEIAHYQIDPTCCFIAIDPLLGFLISRKYIIFILPSNVVASSRGRFPHQQLLLPSSLYHLQFYRIG